MRLMSIDRSRPASDNDAGYQWLLAMCRRWLVERTGDSAEPLPVAPLRAEGWAAVEELGQFHGIEPILFSLFKQAPLDDFGAPAHVRARWEKAYYSHQIRNTEALTVLARLLDGCRDAPAEVLVLKGPAAMADVYRDIALRPMADLDILCRTRDLVCVARIARTLGFHDGSLYLHHVVLRYGAPDGGFLELHFDMHRVMANRARFMESAWREQTTAAIDEWRLPVMSLEHQIVFDVAHCAHHAFNIGLKHVVDFAGRLMLHRTDLNKPRLAALLDETGLTGEFSLLVRTVEKLLQLPLAGAFGSPAGRAREEAFEREFLERSVSFGRVARHVAASGVLREDGVIGKSAYVWRRLFPPLLAAQAAFGSRTRLHALACLPVYAGKTLIHVASQRHKEADL